jgi:hypothetical protein
MRCCWPDYFSLPGGIRVTDHDQRQIGSKECTKVSRVRC